MTAFIDPREMHTPAYDLTVSAAIHTRGDVMVFMTWNTLSSDPVMILVPTGAMIRGIRPIPCIVTLSAAWKWAEETGDPLWALEQAMRFCDNLGFNAHSPGNVSRLLRIIRDYLGDLVSLPPLPNWKMRVVAEMLVTDNATGKTFEKEVTDHA